MTVEWITHSESGDAYQVPTLDVDVEVSFDPPLPNIEHCRSNDARPNTHTGTYTITLNYTVVLPDGTKEYRTRNQIVRDGGSVTANTSELLPEGTQIRASLDAFAELMSGGGNDEYINVSHYGSYSIGSPSSAAVTVPDREPVESGFQPVTANISVSEQYTDTRTGNERLAYDFTIAVTGDLPPGYEFAVAFKTLDSWYTGWERPTVVEFNSLDADYDDMTKTGSFFVDACCLDWQQQASGERTISIPSFYTTYEYRPDGSTEPVAILTGTSSFSDTISLPEARASFSPTARWIDEGTKLTFSSVEGTTFIVKDNWRNGTNRITTGSYTVPTCCSGEGWRPRNFRPTTRRIGVELEVPRWNGIKYSHHIFGPLSRTYNINGTNEGIP